MGILRLVLWVVLCCGGGFVAICGGVRCGFGVWGSSSWVIGFLGLVVSVFGVFCVLVW